MSNVMQHKRALRSSPHLVEERGQWFALPWLLRAYASGAFDEIAHLASKDLHLAAQPTKGRAVQDTITVALKGTAISMRGSA